MNKLNEDTLLKIVSYLNDISQVRTLILCFRSLRECLKEYSYIKERIKKGLERERVEQILIMDALNMIHRYDSLLRDKLPHQYFVCYDASRNTLYAYKKLVLLTKFDYRGKLVYKIIMGDDEPIHIEEFEGEHETITLLNIKGNRSRERPSNKIMHFQLRWSYNELHGETIAIVENHRYDGYKIFCYRFWYWVFIEGLRNNTYCPLSRNWFREIPKRVEVKVDKNKCQRISKNGKSCSEIPKVYPFCPKHTRQKCVIF